MKSGKQRTKSVAFQVDIARQMETPQTLKSIIDFGSSVGYNELFLYGEGSLEYKQYPECSTPWALKQDEFENLQVYAAKRDITLVPVIPVLGHATFALDNPKLSHLCEIKNQDAALMKCNMKQFCSSNPESLKVIESMISEWAAITDAPYIHIGGDESWNFALCPNCLEEAKKHGRGQVLATFFNQVNSIVKKHGKQSVMWHDMLFYYDNCISLLDKDIIICDWHYKPIERAPGISIYNWIKTDFIGTYARENLSFYVCPKSKFNYAEEAHNIKSFLEYSEAKDGVAGFLNTVWEMKQMPYASCYPSLAYGAACCNREIRPEPRTFLQEFAANNYKGGARYLPMLVDLFGQAAELPAFSSLENWLNYQDPTADLTLAGKLDEAIEILESLTPSTVVGESYRITLELIFKRMALSKRIQGLLNEIIRSLRPDRQCNIPQLQNWFTSLQALLAKVPAQIECEKNVWKRYRYEDQPNPIVQQLESMQQQVGSFAMSIERYLNHQTDIASLLPRVLELTLVNNDCSWQYLTISVSQDGKNYDTIGSHPQCGPFGRYIKTFPLPFKANFVKLEMAGLGQLLIHYARIIEPVNIQVPVELKTVEGLVEHPEHVLIDDFKPTIMGSTESRHYFSQGMEQPPSTLELKMG